MRRFAFAAAILIGVASFGLLSKHQQDYEDRVGGGAAVPILVAVEDIALGAVLREEMLVVRDLPEAYLEARHIRASEASKAIGIRVTMGLRGNESLLWTDLAVARDERRDLSSLVTNGMRGVTVRIQRGSSLGGLLRPGDRIDLLLSAMVEGDKVVLPLLQNVLVLAVGRDIGGRDLIKAVQGGSDLTLSVTVAQAQAITLAQGEGTLSASLRNPEDITITRNAPVTTSEDIQLADKRAALQKSLRHAPNPSASSKDIEHVR